MWKTSLVAVLCRDADPRRIGRKFPEKRVETVGGKVVRWGDTRAFCIDVNTKKLRKKGFVSA